MYYYRIPRGANVLLLCLIMFIILSFIDLF